MANELTVPSTSRRSFLSLSAAASAAFALRIVTEPMLAHARIKNAPKDAIRIDSNENPLGPGASAREAAAAMVAQGGRYCDWLTDDLVKTLAEMEGLKPEQIRVYAGIERAAASYGCRIYFAAAQLCTADPGYEAGMFAANALGAKVVKVPLTKTYAHDVKAMLAAAPDAGVFYVCSPNNPTGTLTSHSDIEYLVENKPKGSIVLVDEAYIHFSDATSAMDLVKAGKDVMLLRPSRKFTAWRGCAAARYLARPDLLEKIENYGGWNVMPITAVVAASASLKDTQLVAERKRINAQSPRRSVCVARSQRIFLHPIRVELLHAGYEESGESGDRCHGETECHHWTHLAGDADLYAHHGWNVRRDGAVPGGMAEGDDGRGDGERGSGAGMGRTAGSRAEAGGA